VIFFEIKKEALQKVLSLFWLIRTQNYLWRFLGAGAFGSSFLGSSLTTAAGSSFLGSSLTAGVVAAGLVVVGLVVVGLVVVGAGVSGAGASTCVCSSVFVSGSVVGVVLPQATNSAMAANPKNNFFILKYFKDFYW
jgi:hypothetical protein